MSGRDLIARFYVLDGRVPRETTAAEWSVWFETSDRGVAYTEIEGGSVSTVFMGIDPRPSADASPKVFETLVRGGPCHGDGDRYATWAEAEAGHAAMVARVERGAES